MANTHGELMMPMASIYSATEFTEVARAADHLIANLVGTVDFCVSVSATVGQVKLAERFVTAFPTEEYVWLASTRPVIDAVGLRVQDPATLVAQIFQYRLAGTIESVPPGKFSLSIIPRWSRMGGTLSLGFDVRGGEEIHRTAISDWLASAGEHEVSASLLLGRPTVEMKGNEWSMRLLQGRLKVWTDLPSEDLLFSKLADVAGFVESVIAKCASYSPVFSGDSVLVVASVVQRANFMLFNWAQRSLWRGPLCAKSQESRSLAAEMGESESMWLRWQDDRPSSAAILAGCSVTVRYVMGSWTLELASESSAAFREANRLFSDYSSRAHSE